MTAEISNKDLAIRMATTETEDDIVKLLKDLGYWDNYDYWHPFGDNDNNYSIIGNQQSKADAALVEKLINSVDAILMKECLKRGIAPEGPQAPKNMSDALKKFFDIGNEQISSLTSSERSTMAENIILAVTRPETSARTYMNVTIVDNGEGQTPKRMPGTILSLSRSNKLRVPFVQGKFNMGGTGVLPFCGGANRLQLVISKRCPDIPNSDNDETFDKWSVTIVRREKEREGRRSTMYTYLTDKQGRLLSFSADSLPIIPAPEDSKYEEMKYGAYFKLYNYDINKKNYRSNITLDFYYRISMLIPELGHPIRLRECRGYKSHTPYITLAGLNTRLLDDRNENIEKGFPSSECFYVDNQEIQCSIYVFKKIEGKEKAKNYREKEGILYIVNGQTHASTPDTFFNKVNLPYLADSILVLVDCSKIDISHREDMFMNSRDRLRMSKFVSKIEDQLKTILREHKGLKELQYERRAAAVHDYLENDKPFRDVLQNILKKSPELSRILLDGIPHIQNPFKTELTGGSDKPFAGKKHPTYFRIKGKAQNESITRKVPVNKSFRVQFETDAENDYFTRKNDRGSLELYMDDIPHPELKKHLGLFNGIATLNVSLPEGMKECEIHKFRAEITDDCIPNTLAAYFICEGLAEEPEIPNDKKKSKNDPQGSHPKGDDTSKNKKQSSSLGIPDPKPVYRANWDEYGMDKESALVVRIQDEGSDYFLNMDNQYLLTELKGIKDPNKLELTRARYRYGMTIIGMSIESYYKNRENKRNNDPEYMEDTEDENNVDIPTEIKKISSMVAPILVPMIESMADLDVDSITKPDR